MNIIDMLNEAWNAGLNYGQTEYIPKRGLLADTEAARRADVHHIFAQRAAADMVVEIVDDWQPIETAPTDGRSILGAHKGLGLCAIFYYTDLRWRTNDVSCTRWQPTHWMPLPEAPK